MHYPLPAEEPDLDDLREIVAAHVAYRARHAIATGAWRAQYDRASNRWQRDYDEWCAWLAADLTMTAYRRATEQGWGALRGRVWKRDGGQCHVCGRHISHDRYECGHIVDRVAGGCDRLSNLVVMCTFCNQVKPVHDTRAEYVAWVESGAWMAELGL
jgi:hypothetical protein